MRFPFRSFGPFLRNRDHFFEIASGPVAFDLRFKFPKGVDFLIDDVVNTNNDFGWTPLLIAEGYRPGNFKTSFVTVDVITEIMLSQGAKIPIARPKAYNYYGKDPPASDKAKESNLKKL